ncbi:hypothetical protein [Goodfellowiella coeruleoviolacea]|uniref:Uncharacterized protein n=1 Tax=Goodfellowiella coeruleoviolacea TaxID=334858 RepID=A0AAE3KEW6_9PSEU|nr:hypothetical protein [Goodfellowiella coeruleoviolacea]MCP2165741.1 hypothetical protein [Goodfellowiella coeruleoviolacea]
MAGTRRPNHWGPPPGDDARPGRSPRTAASTAPRTAAPAPDPLVDSDACGLRKFNLGLVPASVTPPPSWRRAAWFAVLASFAALVGLTLAAVEYVAPPDRDRPLTPPGYPANVLMLPDVAGGTADRTTRDPGAAGVAGGPTLTGAASLAAEPRAATTTGAPPAAPSAVSTTPRRPSSAKPELTGQPVPPSPTGAAPSPPVIVPVPPSGPAAAPLVDAEELVRQTVQFYDLVAGRSDRVLNMLSNAFRGQGRPLLRQRYGEVREITIEQITVDPYQAVTVSTLRLTWWDGSVSIARRALDFSSGKNPRINGERLISGD